jgi:hypothetical protein
MTKETKKRIDQLFELGLKWNGSEYFKNDINVHWTEITCSTDEQFNSIVEDITKELKRRENGKL